MIIFECTKIFDKNISLLPSFSINNKSTYLLKVFFDRLDSLLYFHNQKHQYQYKSFFQFGAYLKF